ncbi:hypothetical protein JHK82_053236 [Glycine max]|nr:hypothetical protein JHK84_053103 [Glycine max]KAG5085839.1 hypothetical protein JHK82_053236 [Glycine max]
MNFHLGGLPFPRLHHHHPPTTYNHFFSFGDTSNASSCFNLDPSPGTTLSHSFVVVNNNPFLTMVQSKVVEKPDVVDLDHVTGDLKFCDVSFGYIDDVPLVLNALNLHIRIGEIVVIMGPSGGGKTTLVKLLLWLYDPIYVHDFNLSRIFGAQLIPLIISQVDAICN